MTSNTPEAVSDVQIKVTRNQYDLASQAARELVKKISEIQRTNGGVGRDGFARLVLTGGGAGIETCRQLAQLDHAARQTAEDFPITAIDWQRVLVFFGDERFVDADNTERNELQAREALLNHVEIPEHHIFGYNAPTASAALDGEELDAAAADYAAVISEHAPHGFDIHLLGMGPEGHINSLFPHSEELLKATSPVVAVRNCPKPPSERVSLTIDAVNSADHVWLLVAGAEKREAAQQVAQGGNGAQWPAALAVGQDSTILWVDDEAKPEPHVVGGSPEK